MLVCFRVWHLYTFNVRYICKTTYAMEFPERFYDLLHTRPRIPPAEHPRISKQEQNQLFHAKRTLVYMPIIEKRPDFFQIDTTFYPLRGKTRAIFTAVNVNTKQGYIAPYSGSNPTSQQTVEILKDMLRQYRVQHIGADNGAEFVGSQVKKFLQEHHVELYFYSPYDSNEKAVIERFNSTVKNYLNKIVYSVNANWLPYVRDIMTAYNNTRHSSIGKTPNQMTEDDVDRYIAKQQMKAVEYLHVLRKFTPGTQVRIFRTADPTMTRQEREAEKRFGRKNYPSWSSAIHTVRGIDGYKVVLADLDQRFSPRDLYIVDDVEVREPSTAPLTKRDAKKMKARQNVRAQLGQAVVSITNHGYAEVTKSGKGTGTYITELDALFEGFKKPRPITFDDLTLYDNGLAAFEAYLAQQLPQEQRKIKDHLR
ncbi:MAG: transposase [Actinobacteria bacterium]|nr:transposase [Actinomycetota bacterium]